MRRKNTLEQDMYKLAKLVYDLSMKHGDIYISAAKVEGANHSWTTYRKGNCLEDEWYEVK